jgi:hypothetical protein
VRSLLHALSLVVVSSTSAFADEHTGTVLELAAGMAYTHYTCWDCSRSSTAGPVPSGLAIGLGGWLTPDVSLEVRASTTVEFSCTFCSTLVFLGPSIQGRIDRYWAGAGIGTGLLFNPNGGFASIAADLRVGVALATSGPHTLNLALEIQPSIFKPGGEQETFTTFALTIGYEHSFAAEARADTRRLADEARRREEDAATLRENVRRREQAIALMTTAADAARHDDCATVMEIDPQVRELDADLHDTVFVRDVAIRRCLGE